MSCALGKQRRFVVNIYNKHPAQYFLSPPRDYMCAGKSKSDVLSRFLGL
jgi:hypothetical protein